MAIEIKISGPIGSGKSTAMQHIRNALIKLGYNTMQLWTEAEGSEYVTMSTPNQRTNTYPPPEDRGSAASVGVKSTDDICVKEALKENIQAIPEIVGSNQITALEEAHKVIYGDREKTYGDPGKNLRVIAEYWSVHLKAKYNYNTPLTHDDVCVMMVLLKQARLANTPKHRDSIVDTIGYSALADRVNVAEQEAEERNTPISK